MRRRLGEAASRRPGLEMAGEEDSSDSASVGSALEEVLKDKGRAAAPVRQRLRTASRVLKQQSASDAAALLCDTEAIDSAVTAQDAGGFPGNQDAFRGLLFG